MDETGPPADLGERNRQALERHGLNADLYTTFHAVDLTVVEHFEDGHFYRPRFVRHRDAHEEHRLILYESGDGSETVSEVRDFFRVVTVGGVRTPRFTPAGPRPRTPGAPEP